MHIKHGNDFIYLIDIFYRLIHQTYCDEGENQVAQQIDQGDVNLT
jgi:hypothetical protein